MDKIELHLVSQNGFPASYLAKFSGPVAHNVRSLFGVVDIPTGFTAEADPAIMVDHIKRAWPGAEVVIVQ